MQPLIHIAILTAAFLFGGLYAVGAVVAIGAAAGLVLGLCSFTRDN